MDWLSLGLLLLGSAVVRFVFSNGFFGSDDVVYLQRSIEIANGVWSSANYNGALRYGYNIPAALPIWILGITDWSVTLWPFFCSLAEIAVVYCFSAAFIGHPVAVYSALLLAVTPLHIALPTRVHADAVLACFLTLSFVLFYWAERSRRPATYFFAGLAMGMVFWVKELALVALIVFATYPLVVRRWNNKWLWVIVGGACMLGAHLLLMKVIAGNPLHAIEVVRGQVDSSFIAAGTGEDATGFYFRYLLGDIKHTFVLAYMCLAALGGLAVQRFNAAPAAGHYLRCEYFVLWWLVGLLLVLSFLPVSLHPLRFVMKQSNYLNLFLAPMAILSGTWLSQLRSTGVRNGLLATVVFGGLILGAFEQAAYQVFTSNSKAAVEFAIKHPHTTIVGSTNNVHMAGVRSILDRDPALAKRFLTFAERTAWERNLAHAEPGDSDLLVVLDRENQSWGRRSVVIKEVPRCWTKVQDLHPIGMGAGADVVHALRAVAGKLPGVFAERVDRPLRDLVVPELATVYRISGTSIWCGHVAPIEAVSS